MCVRVCSARVAEEKDGGGESDSSSEDEKGATISKPARGKWGGEMTCAHPLLPSSLGFTVEPLIRDPLR